MLYRIRFLVISGGPLNSRDQVWHKQSVLNDARKVHQQRRRQASSPSSRQNTQGTCLEIVVGRAANDGDCCWSV